MLLYFVIMPVRVIKIIFMYFLRSWNVTLKTVYFAFETIFVSRYARHSKMKCEVNWSYFMERQYGRRKRCDSDIHLRKMIRWNTEHFHNVYRLQSSVLSCKYFFHNILSLCLSVSLSLFQSLFIFYRLVCRLAVHMETFIYFPYSR